MKKITTILVIAVFALLGFLVGFLIMQEFFCKTPEAPTDNTVITKTRPKAIMLLIEFRNTDGLVNMVNDMQKRNIKGLLMVNGDFVQKNTEAIQKVLDTGAVEIAASYDPKAFWDMPYDEQYAIISDMITKIESVLDTKVRIISSRYMAGDENTVKVAHALGIEYITARGTTDLATTVYKPNEYNVKIISVSNIDTPEFKYGSFCDYSYYERSGAPEDMTRDFERAITNTKFIGVSHTYIGGSKARWNNMWHKLWDNYEVDWVNLDELGTVDKHMPMWQIPINKNAPYTPGKIRPVIPYEEEEDVINPCKVDDLQTDTSGGGSNTPITDQKIVMFHNNTGPMCLDAIAFLKENNLQYEEHLTTESDFYTVLSEYKNKEPDGLSSGVSPNYSYYPIIFIGNEAFSGFNEQIKNDILEMIK